MCIPLCPIDSWTCWRSTILMQERGWPIARLGRGSQKGQRLPVDRSQPGSALRTGTCRPVGECTCVSPWTPGSSATAGRSRPVAWPYLKRRCRSMALSNIQQSAVPVTGINKPQPASAPTARHSEVRYSANMAAPCLTWLGSLNAMLPGSPDMRQRPKRNEMTIRNGLKANQTDTEQNRMELNNQCECRLPNN